MLRIVGQIFLATVNLALGKIITPPHGTQVTGLGFKPAWMMVKDIDAGETWYILDNTRQPTNVSAPSNKVSYSK